MLDPRESPEAGRVRSYPMAGVGGALPHLFRDHLDEDFAYAQQTASHVTYLSGATLHKIRIG